MAGRSMFDSVIEYGAATLRAVILLNGGGAIALLAFAGHLFTGGSIELIALASDISLAVVALGVGAGLGGVATVCAYCTQLNYQLFEYYEKATRPNDYHGDELTTDLAKRNRHYRLGIRYHYGALGLVTASLTVFVGAIVFAGYSASDVATPAAIHTNQGCFKVGCD